MPEAARRGDEVSHTEATVGLLAGSVAAAAAMEGTEALVGVAIAAGAVSGGVGFVLVLGIGALACWGLPKLGAMIGRHVDKPPEGNIMATSTNVFINGAPAAHTLDPVDCHAGEQLAEGSKTVFVNRQLASRHGDKTTQGGVVVTYSPDVFIGGPTAQVAAINDIPAWAEWVSTGIMVLPGVAKLGMSLLEDAGGALTRTAEAGAAATEKEGAAAAAAADGAGGETGAGAAADGDAASAAGEDSAAGGRPAEESCETCGQEGEPVNPASGAVFSEHLDFALPGPLPLTFRRVWTSTSTIDGELGHGWHHSLDMALVERPGGRVALRLADGRYTGFARPASGRPSLNPAERLQLWDHGGSFVVTDYDGLAHHFAAPSPDGVRRLAGIADLNGNRITLRRDPAGGLAGITDSAGRDLVVSRDRHGRITGIDGPHPDGTGLLALASFGYGPEGDLVQTRDANGAGFDFTYVRHRITAIRWPAGLTFRFDYDPSGRCTRTMGDDGLFERHFAYDLVARTTTVRDGQGTTRRYEWNGAGRITAVTDGLGRRRTTSYDGHQHVVAETRADGASRSRAYDGYGRVVVDTRFDGGRTTVAYQADRPDGLVLALPETVTDAAGKATRYRFDERANLMAQASPGGLLRRWLRNTRGLPLVIQDAIGVRQRFTWDGAGNLVVHAGSGADRFGLSYDALGRIVSMERAGMLALRYQRDGRGDVIGIERADGTRTALSRDEEGHVTAHRDRAGRLTRWLYAGRSQPLRRIGPDGRETGYEYDADLRLTALVNAKGERASFAYDQAGQMTEQVGFDGRRQRYAYTAAGFLAEHGDEEGRLARYERDPLGRLLQTSFADGTRRTYRYDRLGRLAAADNEARRLEFAWTADGVLAEERQDGLVLRHNSDIRGRRTGTMLPDGRCLAIEWDGDDRFAALSLDGAAITTVRRDGLGRETARRDGALTTLTGYDPQGRLLNQVTRAGGRDPVLARRYAYDDTDRLTEVDDQLAGRRGYAYDSADRLIGTTGEDPEHFVFDPADNLLGSGGLAVGDRLLVHGDSKFEYDDCGNRILERRGAGGAVERAYTYGPDNQLAAVEERSRRGHRRTSFAYDALGRRIAKVSVFTPPSPANDTMPASPVRTVSMFLWNGDVMLAEASGPDALATLYLHDPGTFRPAAQLRRAAADKPAALYHYHLDRIGTPREVTNDDGQIVWRARFRGWGTLAEAPVVDIPQPIRFQGQYADAETGLHYNRFRYYAPGEGRYLQTDPIGFAGGGNLSAYVQDPTSFVDPYGLACENGGKSRLPRSNGSWDGEVGESNWRSTNPEVTAVTGGDPVPFSNGRPDFSQWSKGEITFPKGELNGTNSDFSKVYQEVANQKGLANRTAGKDYLKQQGLTPHHLDDTTIQLIPTDLHGNVPHIGAASDLRGATLP